MSALDLLKVISMNSDEITAKKIMNIYYMLYDEDIITTDNEVVLDDFYYCMLKDAEEDNEESYSMEEVEKLLGMI